MVASIIKTVGLQALTETEDLTCGYTTPTPGFLALTPPLHRFHGAFGHILDVSVFHGQQVLTELTILP